MSTDGAPGLPPAGRAGLAVACLGGLLSGLDTSVNIAFPDITSSFELDVSEIQWVVISFVLTYSVLLLPFGRLADRLGHGRVALTGLVLSAVALSACAAAPDFGLFLAARVAQGAGIALVLAAAPALVTLAVPEGDRPRALGWFQMSVALGLAAGAPVGGLLLEEWSWRSVYAFRVPYTLALLGIGVAGGLWRRTRPEGQAGRQPLDVAGAVTLAAGLGSLLFVASRGQTWGWTNPSTLGLAAVGVAALVAFWQVEGRVQRPLVDFALFEIPGFTLANVLNAVANATMFTVWFLGPYLLVTVRGHGTIPGGLLLGAGPFATAIAAVVAGRITSRLGTGPLSAVGLAVQAVGLAVFSRADAATSTWVVIGSLVLVGAGLGLFQVPNMSFVMGSISRDQQGIAGGMTQMVRTAGVVGGIAVWNVIFVALRERRAEDLGISDVDDPLVFVPSFASVVLVSGVVCGAAALVAAVRRERRAVTGPVPAASTRGP